MLKEPAFMKMRKNDCVIVRYSADPTINECTVKGLTSLARPHEMLELRKCAEHYAQQLPHQILAKSLKLLKKSNEEPPLCWQRSISCGGHVVLGQPQILMSFRCTFSDYFESIMAKL